MYKIRKFGRGYLMDARDSTHIDKDQQWVW